MNKLYSNVKRACLPILNQCPNGEYSI